MSLSQWKNVTIGAALGVISFLLLAFWFKTPQADRDWAEEVSTLPEIELDHTIVTIKNIRDWRWSKAGPTQKAYRTTRYEISSVKNIWFVLEPFEGSKWIGHTYLLFEFDSGPLLGLTVEARKERTESYSALWGMFKKYELAYIWSNAEDLTTRRAIYLQHPQYVWKLNLDVQQKQTLFRQLLLKSQEVARQPRFYNTLFHNCTNELAQSVHLKWGWAHILTGRSMFYLEKQGYISGPIVRDRDISAAIQAINDEDLPSFDRQLLDILPQ
ncbi:MAG: lipoprotein N-acyltransferase Lnb domain-containing protein [bacterium]